MKTKRLGIFGGTSEGRLLAEFCQKQGIPAAISVATRYGSQLLREEAGLMVHTGRMDCREMTDWIREQGFEHVVDATHPFAREASENIRQACDAAGVLYHRLVRSRDGEDEHRPEEEKNQDIRWVGSAEEAACFLAQEFLRYPGRTALITTGSKELSCFASIEQAGERLYARVLPSVQGIQACLDAGLKGNHIIAMQGPFSYEMNLAMLQATKASYLVTKESGRAGGFQEKADAAQAAGCRLVVVGRPVQEQGMSLSEIESWLEELVWKEKQGQKEEKISSRKITLIGIGMGSLEQMTLEGIQALQNSDALLGASRMVESGMAMLKQLKTLEFDKTKGTGWKAGQEKSICITYRPEEMLSWLDDHPEIRHPAILYSGDTGFYSGAKKLVVMAAEQSLPYQFRMVPGISSVAYFAAKLGRSWEQAAVVSLHGRDADESWDLSDGRERFLLLDGPEKLREVCRSLEANGQSEARIWIGERLSYKEERIFSGSPAQMLAAEFDRLAVAWIIPAGGCKA